jgi:hypothetical protein
MTGRNEKTGNCIIYNYYYHYVAFYIIQNATTDLCASVDIFIYFYFASRRQGLVFIDCSGVCIIDDVIITSSVG